MNTIRLLFYEQRRSNSMMFSSEQPELFISFSNIHSATCVISGENVKLYIFVSPTLKL